MAFEWLDRPTSLLWRGCLGFLNAEGAERKRVEGGGFGFEISDLKFENWEREKGNGEWGMGIFGGVRADCWGGLVCA
jgi:hypothetical protein